MDTILASVSVLFLFCFVVFDAARAAPPHANATHCQPASDKILFHILCPHRQHIERVSIRMSLFVRYIFYNMLAKLVYLSSFLLHCRGASRNIFQQN